MKGEEVPEEVENQYTTNQTQISEPEEKDDEEAQESQKSNEDGEHDDDEDGHSPRRKIDKFGGMKYNREYIKKLYDMIQASKTGDLYDDKIIEKSLFSFLMDKNESRVCKAEKKKFSFKRSDISPFRERKRSGDPDLILTYEEAYEKELKKVIDKSKRERRSKSKLIKQIKTHIDEVSFAQPILNNCCYHPIQKLRNNEIYDNDKFSNSQRTRSIIENSVTQPLNSQASKNHSIGLLNAESETILNS